MSRSRWKTLIATNTSVQNRTNTITPNLLNKEIFVNNGKTNKSIYITIEHIGHKFGEFVATKSVAKYKKNDK